MIDPQSKMAPPTDDEVPPPDDPGASNSQTMGQSSMMNGPSSNNERPWERPWSLAEMRKSAKDWSLAGDAGMLQYLQEFSQRMISRTHEIQEEVNGLIHESKLTSVRVNNAFIDFIMLANTQFVENRVYDEDVAQDENAQEEKKDDKDKTREQREAELIPKISQALTLGLNVIDTAFEKLDVNEANSDSEEDEDTSYRTDPILEPKDPYITRALPYLIGTQAFMQDDDVGLVDLPSDVEEEDQGTLSETESSSEEDSDDERRAARQAGKPYESDSESEYSSSVETDSSAEEEKVVRKPRKKKKSGSDLFGKGSDSEELDSESDEDALAPAKSGKPLGFADELASKIRAPAVVKDEAEEHREPDKPDKKRKDSGKKEKHKAKVKKKVDEDNLFGPAEDEDDDDDSSSPFGKKGGLFSSGGGLFDDDEEQGGLFDDITSDKPKNKTKEVKRKEPETESESEDSEEEVKRAPKEPESRGRTKSGKKMPAGAVSIFGGGDDELFGPSKEESEEEEPVDRPKAKSVTKTTIGGGLFDDDDGADLFAEPSSSKKPAVKKATSKPSKPTVDLFGGEEDDEEGDLFAETSVKKSKKPSNQEDLFGDVAPKESTPVVKAKDAKPQKRLPPGAVSMFGGAANPLVAAIKSQRPPSDEDEGDKSEEERSERSSGSKSSASARLKAGQRERSASLSSNSLFADEPEDDLFSAKPKATSNKPDSKVKSNLGGGAGAGLFEDDGGDGDDLFASLPTKKPTENKKKVSQTKAKSSGLFLDDDGGEGDLFATAAPKAVPSKKKPTGGVALFGGANLFGDTKSADEDKSEEKKEETKPSRPKDLPKKEEPAQPRKNTLSLFDENGEDEDLFSSVGDQTAKVVQAKTVKPEAADKEDQAPHKPRTRSVMLFEDEDVLFGAAEENPSVDLFGSQSPLSPTEQNKPFPGELESNLQVKSTNSGTVSIGGATTTASSTDLFASNEDDDDLFSITRKAVPRKALSSRGKVSLAGATTTESSSDLFGEKTGGSLFGQKENTAQEEKDKAEEIEKKKEDEEPKPKKKMAGAVSMFGGMDPGALLKKKSDITGEPSPGPTLPDKPLPQPKQREEPLGAEDESDGAFVSKSSKPNIVKKPPPPIGGKPKTAPPPAKKPAIGSQPKGPSKGSAIGKLQANLAINPSALLPGATPPVAEPETQSVGFDQPAQAKTLHNVAKDRAKIQTKRRPPSRMARRAAAAQSDADYPDSSASQPAPPVANSNPPSNAIASTPPIRKHVPDLFGNDDLLSDSSIDRSEPMLGTEEPEKEDTKSDLFSSKSDDVQGIFTTSGSKSKPTPEEPSTAPDDIFSSTVSAKVPDKKMAATDDIFGTPSSVPVVAPPKDSDDIFGTPSSVPVVAPPKDSDDIFGTPSTVPEVAPPKDSADIFTASTASSKPAKPVLPTADDDIFASSSLAPSKPKTKPPVMVEDDIFADSSVGIKKSSRAATPAADVDDIFSEPVPKAAKAAPAEDQDDIFSVAPKKSSHKKAVTKDEDLFRDDTDIFADLPPSKPKEKKTKKKAAPGGEKSIFKDDIDDIFASATGTVKPKTKKSTTSKKKTTGAAKGASIFDDDAPNIFDDPLSAMK